MSTYHIPFFRLPEPMLNVSTIMYLFRWKVIKSTIQRSWKSLKHVRYFLFWLPGLPTFAPSNSYACVWFNLRTKNSLLRMRVLLKTRRQLNIFGYGSICIPQHKYRWACFDRYSKMYFSNNNTLHAYRRKAKHTKLDTRRAGTLCQTKSREWFTGAGPRPSSDTFSQTVWLPATSRNQAFE